MNNKTSIDVSSDVEGTNFTSSCLAVHYLNAGHSMSYLVKLVTASKLSFSLGVAIVIKNKDKMIDSI